MNNRIFICFSATDRETIVSSLVYHLKDYGLDIWYDRSELLMGDNRQLLNLVNGATKSHYAVIIVSENTIRSKCAMEEIRIIRQRFLSNSVIVFPILFEIRPDNLPPEFSWIKDIIFKEVTRNTGSIEACNHIACKVTKDLLSNMSYHRISDLPKDLLPEALGILLSAYDLLDHSNLNSRVTLLYSIYQFVRVEIKEIETPAVHISDSIFHRIFSMTSLNVLIDYRELWLLENSLCILINTYLKFRTESNI